jgi:hypothetical protein
MNIEIFIHSKWIKFVKKFDSRILYKKIILMRKFLISDKNKDKNEDLDERMFYWISLIPKKINK